MRHDPYEVLGVSRDAGADEIKRAFRAQIAKYHPDKVQHLGQEFQQMAAAIAADLTEAYRILMDADLRAQYDESLRTAPPDPKPPLQWATTPPPRRTETAQPYTPPPPSEDRAPRAPSSTAGSELVKRAALLKLRDAVSAVFGGTESPAAGFDAMFVSKPKKGLFRKADDAVRLLVRFVPQVDTAAIADVWPRALKTTGEGIACVLLLGASLGPASELAASVSEQRRRSRNLGPVLVPVDVRDWEALFPPDTPDVVRVIMQRLRE
jgi:curved DNA-binding protein CbpA